MMAHRLEESGSGTMTDSQKSDLIIEFDKTLDNDLSAAGTTTLLRDLPCLINVSLGPDGALTMTGRTHHRLHDAWDADFRNSLVKFLTSLCETVRRCRKPQSLRCQTTYSFTVHGKSGCLCCRNHIETLLLKFYKTVSSDSLDLRNDVIRRLLLDHSLQSITVKH